MCNYFHIQACIYRTNVLNLLQYALKMPSEHMQPEASVCMLLQAAGANLISQSFTHIRG